MILLSRVKLAVSIVIQGIYLKVQSTPHRPNEYRPRLRFWRESIISGQPRMVGILNAKFNHWPMFANCGVSWESRRVFGGEQRG